MTYWNGEKISETTTTMSANVKCVNVVAWEISQLAILWHQKKKPLYACAYVYVCEKNWVEAEAEAKNIKPLLTK